ncbi:MAG: hypothetical protein WDN30_08205 [Pararobbsia sp.]
MWKVLWPIATAGIALGVVLDMRRLRINRAGLSRTGWVLACACAGPLAGAAYCVIRKRTRRRLIDSVWQLVGDATQSTHVRRERLVALQRSGLVSDAVFKACLVTLDTEGR